MSAPAPRLASLSLDLDNQWSYLKTRGDPAWRRYPSYLARVVPRTLSLLARHRLTITYFVVGRDAAVPAHEPLLREIVRAGHEVGNHSFEHEPWLHRYPPERLAAEIDCAHAAIHAATGRHCRGFRGPGFSHSPALLDHLVQRGYRYDCSSLPTFIGPLARAYYLMSARLSRAERRRRAQLFGSWREGLRPLRPYRLRTPHGSLAEIPVTTLPLLRTPIHVSYLLYLAGRSPALARRYFRTALALLDACRVPPSLLLHPLDFLGCDDGVGLDFFPGMDLPRAVKLALLDEILALYRERYRVVPLHQHARSVPADRIREVAP